MILKRLIICIGVLSLITACNKLKGPEKPKDLISKDKMVDILIDINLIKSARSKNKTIINKAGLKENTYIYEKYKIDSLQFASSNSYYTFYIEDYEGIYEQVIERLKKIRVSLKEQEALEWKRDTKREADSMPKALKDEGELKLLSRKDSLKVLNIKDSIKNNDALLKKHIKE